MFISHDPRCTNAHIDFSSSFSHISSHRKSCGTHTHAAAFSSHRRTDDGCGITLPANVAAPEEDLRRPSSPAHYPPEHQRSFPSGKGQASARRPHPPRRLRLVPDPRTFPPAQTSHPPQSTAGFLRRRFPHRGLPRPKVIRSLPQTWPHLSVRHSAWGCPSEWKAPPSRTESGSEYPKAAAWAEGSPPPPPSAGH